MDYDELVNQVQERAQSQRRYAAVKAVRTTFETLAEYLPKPQAARLALHLPKEVRQYILYSRSGVVERFSVKLFFQRMANRANCDAMTAVTYAQCVMEVLRDTLPPGELDDFREHLPAEFAPLFETTARAAG